MDPVSIRPSTMVEGGAIPVNQNLTLKEARFNLFDYQGKAPVTTACRLVLVSDSDEEYEQQYSVGNPDRFQPSEDGKTLVAVGEAVALNKSCNFAVLMDALVNAGFPENKLGADISALDGLYAYWIGVPEPSRAGIARTAEQEARGARVVLVPSQLHTLPGE